MNSADLDLALWTLFVNCALFAASVGFGAWIAIQLDERRMRRHDRGPRAHHHETLDGVSHRQGRLGV